MRILITITLLIGLFSCSDRQNNSGTKIDFVSGSVKPFVVTAIEAKFPLRLDEINLEVKNNTIHLNDGIVSKINETIKEYAKELDFYGSPQTYKDTYINTLLLKDSLQTIFIILLKHHPTGELNSRVLFYDNEKKEFAETEFDFKLYALYEFSNGKFIPTNLKTNFKITSPEIALIDFNKDGINDYKFQRLWHNGTFNSIHTTVLTIDNLTVDTLYFCERELGELAVKKSCL